MARLSEMLPEAGQYLKAKDFTAERAEVEVTIECVRIEEIAGESREPLKKPVLYFVGKEKGLVLNRTNTEFLIEAFGDDDANLHGKRVILYRTVTSFKGENVPALRLRLPGMVDDVPF